MSKQLLIFVSLAIIISFSVFVSALEDFSYNFEDNAFQFSSYGGAGSFKSLEIFPSNKGLTFILGSNLNENMHNIHIDIAGCDSFDYAKTVKPKEGIYIGSTREMPILNCSILEAINNKTIKILYKNDAGVQKTVKGWIYFTIPEAIYVHNCYKLSAKELSKEMIIDNKCWEKIRTPTNFKFCYDKETNVLYHTSGGGKPYSGGGVIVYTNMNGVVQFSSNVCASIKKIRSYNCADTEEEMWWGKYDTEDCGENQICYKGGCIETGVCPAKIKFETSGSIIAPGHFPSLFIRTYDSQGKPIKSIITSYEYFNSEKTGESVLEIPQEGFKIEGLEKEKFEQGSYKIVLNSPVSSCKTEKVVEFTMKESMSAFDRIFEFFRWIF